MDWARILYGVLILLGLMYLGSRWIPGLKTVNIEETAEETIKAETDVGLVLPSDTSDLNIEEDND